MQPPALDWEGDHLLSPGDAQEQRELEKLGASFESELSPEDASAITISSHPLLESAVGFSLLSQATGGLQNVRYLTFCDTIPEYPPTHPDGFAVVIRVSHLSPEEASNVYSDIQYGRGAQSNLRWHSKDKICPILGDAVCKIAKSVCSGLQVCQDLAASLRDGFHHTKVNENLMTDIYRKRTEIIHNRERLVRDDAIRSKTWGFYNKQQARYSRKCGTQCPGGRMRISQFAGSDQFFLGCSQWRQNDGLKHFFNRLSTLEGLDVQYLRRLIAGNAAIPPLALQECETMLSSRSRLKACPIHEIQGGIRKQECNVQFLQITPDDLGATPFLIFASWGKHTHAPPPLTKPTRAVKLLLRDLIAKLDVENLTYGRFFQSRELQQFLQNQELTGLPDLHESLQNRDLVQSFILKQRILHHPLGQHWTGVVVEYLNQRKAPSEAFIQDLHNDGVNLRAICFTMEQAMMFGRIQFFQTDMTFKRVAGAIKEIVFVTRDEILQQTIVLARVFTNKDSSDMYYHMYQALFPLIEKAIGCKITWRHINQSGLCGAAVDQCRKQASGLGRYLHDIQPSRTWQQHIQNVFLYCRVHYERNLKPFQNVPEIGIMRKIPCAISKDACQALIDQLKRSGRKEVRDWAKNLNTSWIKSGINIYFSQMPQHLFRQFTKTTNLIEGTHATTNRATGIQLALLPAIQRCRECDTRALKDRFQYSVSGIRPRQRVITPGSYQSRSHPQDSDNSEDPTLGTPPPTTRKRRCNTQTQTQQERGTQQLPIEIGSPQELPVTPLVEKKRRTKAKAPKAGGSLELPSTIGSSQHAPTSFRPTPIMDSRLPIEAEASMQEESDKMVSLSTEEEPDTDEEYAIIIDSALKQFDGLKDNLLKQLRAAHQKRKTRK